MIKLQPLVIQLCPRLNSGGIERGTIDLAIALKKAGFASMVISGGGFLEKELQLNGITHITLPIYSKNPFIFITNLINLTRILKKLNPDIIHPRSRIPSWLIFFLRKKLKGHFLTSCNGIHSLDKFGFKKIYNQVLVKGERVIVNSEFTKNYLLENYCVVPQKIAVIYRGVDTDRFNLKKIDPAKLAQLAENWGVDKHSFKILLPARLAFWKGQHIFIEACHFLKAEGKLDFIALLVGDCQNQSYLRSINELIKHYSLQKEVKICGEAQDMRSVYGLADLVISSSIKPEAFGRSIVEAQAMGRLVIASNHGGSAETIIANQTGWLYPSQDYRALAQQILAVAQLTEKDRLKVITQAMQRVESMFSKKQMCDQYIKLYKKLL